MRRRDKKIEKWRQGELSKKKKEVFLKFLDDEDNDCYNDDDDDDEDGLKENGQGERENKKEKVKRISDEN